MSTTRNDHRRADRPAHPTVFALVLAAACTGALAGCAATGSTTTPSPTTPPVTSSESPTPAPSPTPVIDPGDGGNYAPEVDPANFVEVVDNPYLPLAPGSRWVYEGVVDGEMEHVEVVVTNRRRMVMGISAVVVRDTVSTKGVVTEDTFDWFAQDKDGNVWYLGESTKEYENGEVSSTAGSWEAGVGGALPGIAMPADPSVGMAYRQEFLLGEAEDLAEVITVGGARTVPAGGYTDVVGTREWTPLTPDEVEEKDYAPGVGLIGEADVAGGVGSLELITFISG